MARNRDRFKVLVGKNEYIGDRNYITEKLGISINYLLTLINKGDRRFFDRIYYEQIMYKVYVRSGLASVWHLLDTTTLKSEISDICYMSTNYRYYWKQITSSSGYRGYRISVEKEWVEL